MEEPQIPENTAGAARERLLAVALELFNAKGYAATSVREIVAAAGVTKPVLYYYFGSKEGIYLELMENTYAMFRGILSQFAAASGPARERVKGFAAGIFDPFCTHLDVARLIYSIFYGPPQGAPPFPHEQYFPAMLETVREMVREGVERGEFHPVNLDDVSWAVISCMNTVMEEQLCHTPPRIGREGLLRLLDLVLNGITRGEKK